MMCYSTDCKGTGGFGNRGSAVHGEFDELIQRLAEICLNLAGVAVQVSSEEKAVSCSMVDKPLAGIIPPCTI